jgi:hypothetical protein
VIGAKKVTAPDGTVWRVGRQWLPTKPTLWRPKKRPKKPAEKRSGGGGGGGDLFGGLDSFDEGFLIALALIAVVVVVILLVTVVFPILVLGIEVLIVIVLLVGGLAARLVFRKPWTIRARAEDGRELTWRAPGFQRSGRVRDDAATALALGQTDVHPSEAA